MTNLESFEGGSRESFIDSGLESRGIGGGNVWQLIVLAALDESGYWQSPTSLALGDLNALIEAKQEAETMGVSLNFGLLDYETISGETDLILPPEIEFPYQYVSLLASGIPRVPGGNIYETAADYVAWTEQLATQDMANATSVVHVVDDSGSMTLDMFQGVQLQALSDLTVKYPGIETLRVFYSAPVERWLLWFADEWERWKVLHPQ